MTRILLNLIPLIAFSCASFAQQEATPENKSETPMDTIIFKTGTVFQGQIVEGKKTLIDDPNRYEIVLQNGQTVSIEDVGQIETIKMDGMVLNDPLRHGGRGRLLDMLDEYRSKETAEKTEAEKSKLTARVGWLLGEPERNKIGSEELEILKGGAVVFPGEEIRTQSNSRLQLRVASAFTIGLEQGTLLRINGIEFGETEQDVILTFELVRGSLWAEREQLAGQEGKVTMRTVGLAAEFPHGLKRLRKSPNGDLTVTNYEGPTFDVVRTKDSESVSLPRRTQARMNSLMIDGSRALKPEVTQVGDPIDWFEFNLWKPVEIDLPNEFVLTSHDRLQARPVRPLMGVSSDNFVFQDMQPIQVTGLNPLLSAYRQALADFLTDTGRFPTPQEGLAVLRSASGEIQGWNGPYLDEEIPDSDPWGNPLEYGLIQLENRTLVNLYSIGQNKIDEQGLGDDLR